MFLDTKFFFSQCVIVVVLAQKDIQEGNHQQWNIREEMHISSMKNFLTHFQRQFTSAPSHPVYTITMHRLRKRNLYYLRELHHFNLSKDCGAFFGKHIHSTFTHAFLCFDVYLMQLVTICVHWFCWKKAYLFLYTLHTPPTKQNYI